MDFHGSVVLLLLTDTLINAFLLLQLVKCVQWLKMAIVPWTNNVKDKLEKIMGAVQVDQTVIDNAASAIESLVSAVTAFLASPHVQELPDAATAGLSQAVADAGTAQTALTDASPTSS